MSICKRLCYFSTPSGECKKTDNVPCPLEAPAPVVHGRWLSQHCVNRLDLRYKCSICQKGSDLTTNYCPNCGAKMGE